QRALVSASSLSRRSHPHTAAPALAKACAMARPKPWAAPVTSAVRPLKSNLMIPVLACDPSYRHALAQEIQGLPTLYPSSSLDIADQFDETGGQRRRHAVLAAELDHGAQLHLGLGAPLAHCEITPDTAVGLG